MFCSFYLIFYIIWFQFSLSLSPFYYFDYYEHQYFTSVLLHMFSFIKNALFGSYSWMSHRTFIESSAVTTAFWLDQYGGRFASIFWRCPPSMFWGQCSLYKNEMIRWFPCGTWRHSDSFIEKMVWGCTAGFIFLFYHFHQNYLFWNNCFLDGSMWFQLFLAPLC